MACVYKMTCRVLKYLPIGVWIIILFFLPFCNKNLPAQCWKCCEWEELLKKGGELKEIILKEDRQSLLELFTDYVQTWSGDAYMSKEELKEDFLNQDIIYATFFNTKLQRKVWKQKYNEEVKYESEIDKIKRALKDGTFRIGVLKGSRISGYSGNECEVGYVIFYYGTKQNLNRVKNPIFGSERPIFSFYGFRKIDNSWKIKSLWEDIPFLKKEELFPIPCEQPECDWLWGPFQQQ